MQENRFSSKMAAKTDEELQHVLANKQNYQSDAVLAAVWELEKRDLASESSESIKEKIANPEPQSTSDGIKAVLVVPNSVNTAVNMMYVGLGISVLSSILMFFMDDRAMSGMMVALTLLFTIGITLWLASEIKNRKNWARITNLVLLALGMLAYPFTIGSTFEFSPLIGLLSIVQTFLQLYSLYLMFNKESNEWFKEVNPQKIVVGEDAPLDQW